MSAPALEDTAYVSYGQILIFDQDVALPGLHWSDQHYAQGFARQPSSIALRTLIEYGEAVVRVWIGSPATSLESYIRAHALPLVVSSGTVLIEGPEEHQVRRTLSLPKGNYRLVLGQAPIAEDEQRVDLFFERVHEPLSESAVLLQDEDLAPVMPYLETAETAQA